MLYYISMLSTTGGKLKVSPKKIIKKTIIKLRKLINSKILLLVLVLPEKTIGSLKKADGLVVGSALCKEISKSVENRQNPVTNVTNMVRRLKNKII